MKADSKFIKKYTKKMTKIMKRANPKWDEDKIEKVVTDMIIKQMKNPTVTLDNNYTGETRDTTLLSVFDWALDRKPLIAGNGTFYKNQYEALNPIAQMLDDMAASRKKYKNKMFKAGEEFGGESNEYKDLDRSQMNEKVNMNSYYGASGAPSSAFYSVWSGPATTLTAQSVISTAETLFESFLADNYIYLNMTELLEWCETVLKNEKDTELDDFIHIKSIHDVHERLIVKILNTEDNDSRLLNDYLSSLTDVELTLLYYKNNMIEFFTEYDEVKYIFDDIFNSVENMEYVDTHDEDWYSKIPSEYMKQFSGKTAKDWNKFVDKSYFMGPNDPPKPIVDNLETLSNFLLKYIYTKYLSVDRIFRLRNFKRSVVTVIDTDSNFLSLDTLINYIMENVVGEQTFGRDDLHNMFIAVNTITYTITIAIESMLLYYGECANIPEEFRPCFNMKNEFLNTLLIIGKAKKRYISQQRLREGNLLNPPKADIKGFDFKKATTSEEAEKVFMDLIERHILDSDNIEISGMIKDLKEFKEQIKESIMNGERTYLPNGSAKEMGAYKDPASEQSVRGVLAWNYLNPDNNIELPSKVSLVKMNLFTENDIEPLKKTHPDIYDTIMDKIFNDKTGFFVSVTKEVDRLNYVAKNQKDWLKYIPKKYRTKYKKLGIDAWNKFIDSIDLDDPKYAVGQENHLEYKKRGLQVLAIPSNATIPEWALPYIDYSTMINNIIAPFKPVLEIFGPQFAEEGRSVNGVNRKTAGLTNIIKF